MPIFYIFPLWRLRSPFVWSEPSPDTDPLPPLSDKMARDIGIDTCTLAKLRHQWPSQSVPQAQHDHLVRHIKGR